MVTTLFIRKVISKTSSFHTTINDCYKQQIIFIYLFTYDDHVFHCNQFTIVLAIKQFQ